MGATGHHWPIVYTYEADEAFHGKVGGVKSIRREGETMWSASLVQAPQRTYGGADETLNRGLWDFWQKLRMSFNYSKHAEGWLYPGNPSWLALQVGVSIPLPENKRCCPLLYEPGPIFFPLLGETNHTDVLPSACLGLWTILLSSFSTWSSM